MSRIIDWENSNSRPDVVQFHEFRLNKDRQVVRARLAPCRVGRQRTLRQGEPLPRAL